MKKVKDVVFHPAMPRPKLLAGVGAGSLAAAISTLVIAALKTWTNVEVPEEMVTEFVSVVVGLLVFYFWPDYRDYRKPGEEDAKG